MRVLCLTNFYPPHEIGGEAQSCQDVVQALRMRGHQVAVLTSTHGVRGAAPSRDGVIRELKLEMELGSLHAVRFFVSRRRREVACHKVLQRAVGRWSPDVLFVWGMWNLPRSVLSLAEDLRPGKVAYRFADYWATLPSQHEMYWRGASGRPGMAWLKRSLAGLALSQIAAEAPPAPLNLQNAYCISLSMRRSLIGKGLRLEGAPVTYNGVDTELFHPRPPRARQMRPLNLVYAGRLAAEKGVHTAVEAMALLVAAGHGACVRLAIIGGGEGGYPARLQDEVISIGLSDYVSFRGSVAKPDMPSVLRDFDALLFPSIWSEPFGRVLIEAMASGLTVVAARVGAVPEIATDGRDALLFAPGDATELAARVRELLVNPGLRERLAQAGRRTVVERFAITRMVDEVEAYLANVARHKAPRIARAQAPLTIAPRLLDAAAQVSIIIPTLDRGASLAQTLEALRHQRISASRFEVIVADDGSTDGTDTLVRQSHVPFDLRFVNNPRKGAAAARNSGALAATGRILLFLDSDIIADPELVREHIKSHVGHDHALVFGHRAPWAPAQTSPLSGTIDLDTNVRPGRVATFQEAYSANLSMRTSDFRRMGGFDEAFPASGCEDVDLAYRTQQQGLHLVYNPCAIGYHNHPLDLRQACRRELAYHTSYAYLLSKHPELAGQIVHLQDKYPLDLGNEPLALSARKIAWRALGLGPVGFGMEALATVLERIAPAPWLLRPLYWKILGSCQLAGLRLGMARFGWRPGSD